MSIRIGRWHLSILKLQAYRKTLAYFHLFGPTKHGRIQLGRLCLLDFDNLPF